MAKKSAFLGLRTEDIPYLAVALAGGWLLVTVLALQVEIGILKSDVEALKAT